MAQRVAIVGAGYSGLALAYHLAEDFHVTIFEKKSHPFNHNTTGALLYRAYDYLREMGIDPAEVTQNPIEQAMMIYGDKNFDLKWFIHCDFRQGHPFEELSEEDLELGMVRLANTATVLSALEKKCVERGVEIKYDTSYQGHEEQEHEILVTTLNVARENSAYDFLIGADGWNSGVAQNAGLLMSYGHHTGAELIYPGRLNTEENTAVGVCGPAVGGGYGWLAHMTGITTEVIADDLAARIDLEIGQPLNILQAGVINHQRHKTKVTEVKLLIEKLGEVGLVDGTISNGYKPIAGNVPLMVPGKVAKGRMALVGDAGNTPRNLTEEGISGAFQNAKLLAGYMLENPSLNNLNPYNGIFRRTQRRRKQLKERILSELAEAAQGQERLYGGALLLASKYYARRDQFTFGRIKDLSDFVRT